MSKLKIYLKNNRERVSEFAARIGCNRSTVHRLITGERRPGHGMMLTILHATGGAVTPNDFAGVKTIIELPEPTPRKQTR